MGHYIEVLTYGITDQNGFSSGHSSKILRKQYFYEGVPVTALRHRELPDNHSFTFDLINMDIYHEVKKIFKTGEFNLYHCAHPLYITSSIKAAKDSGVKVVLMFTDYWFMCPLGIMLRFDNTLCEGPDEGRNCLKYCFKKVGDENMRKRITDSRKLLDYCDCFLSPSHFLIGLFNHAGFIDSNRFTLSRHGFDYAKKKRHFFKNPGDVITFGYIGTVQYHKGAHVMVEGFKRARHQNIRLEVWGGCFHEVGFQRSVKKIAGKDDRIKFKGSYDFNDIENILEGIDVVIVPSIWYENAPLTITSSLAYGVPVITSNIGGMSELVKDGHNGLTFRVGDSSNLSAKISMIASNPAIINAFKHNIQYPIRVEEEAFNTELIYKQLFG